MKFQRMPPATRKRIFVLLCLLVAVCLLMRYIGLHTVFLSEGEELPRLQHRIYDGAPVVVAVYYEALCPDSKHFIIKQLLPAYTKAAPIIEVQLVPYGKATTSKNADGSYSFDCQHGPSECEANRYHACTTAYVEDAVARLEMIACMIRDNRLPKDALLKCAKELNVPNVEQIEKCHDSAEGGNLLNLNGVATDALHPHVSFIPTVTLDGSQKNQASILKNLLADVCKIAGDMPEAKELCKLE